MCSSAASLRLCSFLREGRRGSRWGRLVRAGVRRAVCPLALTNLAYLERWSRKALAWCGLWVGPGTPRALAYLSLGVPGAAPLPDGQTPLPRQKGAKPLAPEPETWS